MAVAHVDGKAVSWDGIANPQIPALTSHGNAVGVQILWNDVDSRTITSVKYGGSSGTDMTAVTGATIDQTGAQSPLAPNAKGRGYRLITGSSGDDKVYIVFSGACTGSAHSQSVSGVDGADPIHASSGFGLGDSATYAITNLARSFILNQTGIPTDTDEVVVYAGMMYCGPGSTVTSITSSTGTASSSTTPLNSRTEGAAFYDVSDSTSEQATVTLTAPQYYYTPSFAWYQPPATAVMVGWAWNAGTGGGNDAIDGAIPITVTPAGTLKGTGAIDGTSALAFSGSGTLGEASAAGPISGEVQLSVAGAGVLSGLGAVDGNVPIAMSLDGTMGSQGSMQGTISIGMSLSATPTINTSLSDPQATPVHNGWTDHSIHATVS